MAPRCALSQNRVAMWIVDLWNLWIEKIHEVATTSSTIEWLLPHHGATSDNPNSLALAVMMKDCC